ncbi:MAG: RsmD family RNA methyltransferase [Prevotellaceae bacterium]|jgi:16S rRNA (guanine(966)-N(2))-methyltransferase RsmD|nr:RsmD family RNA methyltransferase [Prevotellaceae bacterium]
MRIIGGTLRGKTIVPPARFRARPTTDFAKESLFNILENRYDFSAARVLDLFAGTGGISYEFASRGCPHMEAVEMNTLHAAFIKKTAGAFKLPQIHVVKLNVFDFLEICTAGYDLIFADPPYNLEGIASLPGRIMEKNILREKGCLIVEHAAGYDFSAHPGFAERRSYGAVNFSFFTPAGAK